MFSRTLSHALAQWKRRLQKQTCALKIVRRQSSGRSTGLAETSRHSIVHAQTFSSNNVTSPLPPPFLPLLQSNVTPQESSHDCRITSSLYRICTLFCWMFLPNMQSSQSTPPSHKRQEKKDQCHRRGSTEKVSTQSFALVYTQPANAPSLLSPFSKRNFDFHLPTHRYPHIHWINSSPATPSPPSSSSITLSPAHHAIHSFHRVLFFKCFSTLALQARREGSAPSPNRINPPPLLLVEPPSWVHNSIPCMMMGTTTTATLLSSATAPRASLMLSSRRLHLSCGHT